MNFIRRHSGTLSSAGFVLGFLGTAWVLAQGLTAIVYRYGIFISPKFLMLAAMVGFMVVLALAYIQTWKGFLFRRFAARPNISITKDVMGLRTSKEHPSVVHTHAGLRVLLEVSLPCAEATDLKRETHRALRLLFRYPVVSALYFQAERSSVTHIIDGGVEPNLAKILQCDNQRLKTLSSRGELKMQCCIEIESLEDARHLAEESDLIRLIPWEEYGKSLGLWRSGAISHGSLKARQIPAVVEHEGGLMMPLLVTDYDGNTPTFNHHRIQELSIHLGRPVFWQCISFAIDKGEVRRIKRVAAMESAYPKSMLDADTREVFREKPQRIARFEAAINSGRKPRLLKQLVWIQVNEGDSARVLLTKAQEWLFEQGLTAKGLTPTRALAAHASMYPGLEKYSADTSQGLGIAGTEDEVFCEMEAVSTWSGHDDPNLILTDAAGKTLRFSLFEGGNNFNMVIVGEPGSGKSVVINGLTTSHLSRSRFNKAILVDYGGSFSGLVEAASGLQISHHDRGKFTISPLPIFEEALSIAAFQKRYPNDDYQEYLERQQNVRQETLKQSLVFIKNLCVRKVEDTGVFRELFFELVLQHAKPGKKLSSIIGSVCAQAKREKRGKHSAIRRRAYQDLIGMFEELASICKISPFIGDNGIDLRKQRLISFNLDGFSEDDKQILVGLISLLIHQVFGERVAGKTLIVFDEVHKFIHAGSLGTLLDATSRVTRKYGASLVLASQSPADYAKIPALIENANHHVIMRLKTGKLSPEWKVTDEAILEHARTGTPPADAVGYSTLHLGTTTPKGDLQGVFHFAFTPLALYPFTSKLRDKNQMRLACHLTGLGNTIDLAELVHGEAGGAVRVGSPTFWQQVMGALLPEYEALRGHLLQLFADPEVQPFLDLYLKPKREEFERIARNPQHLNQFIQENEVTQ